MGRVFELLPHAERSDISFLNKIFSLLHAVRVAHRERDGQKVQHQEKRQENRFHPSHKSKHNTEGRDREKKQDFPMSGQREREQEYKALGG